MTDIETKLYGTLANGTVVLTGPDDGLPVELAEAPYVGEGYELTYSWEQAGSFIRQVWGVRPTEGTEGAAQLALCKMLAAKLDDRDALKVVPLFDEWRDLTGYAAGDRVRYGSTLWLCLSAHQSQTGKTPDTEPALWREVRGE